MATVDMATLEGNTRPSLFKNVTSPYMVEVELDFADAATTKGSALAALDEIEVVNVPAGSVVLAAGLRVEEAMTGTSTDATISVGITGGDVDQWVAAFDLDAASAGDFAPVAAGSSVPALVTADDTIDVLIATQTGTITGGKVTVWAYMLDVSNKTRSPGRAQLGS